MSVTRHIPVFFVIATLLFMPLHDLFAKPAKKKGEIAMLLCVLPGGGQFYTERYIPGIAIGSTELALGYFAYKYHQEEKYEERNSLLWWGLFVFGFSLADAYVGAKMYGFDVETDIDRVSVSYTISW